MLKVSCRMGVLVFVVLMGIMLVGTIAVAAEQAAHGQPSGGRASNVFGLEIAAALAIGISILGAGYAVGRIGSAALGAILEKPELLTRAILFVALAEGLAVLGFAVAMMLMQKM